MPPASMNRVAIQCSAGMSQWPIEASEVEKPPVETRRQRVRHRLEGGHPGKPVEEGAEQGQADIVTPIAAAIWRARGMTFSERSEDLGPEQLHAADAQGRQDGDRDGDDADAAQPLQQRAPQQQAGRRRVEADDDRGAGRGQARHALEEGVGEAVRERAVAGEGKRHRAEQGHHRPAQRGQDEGLAQRQAALEPATGGVEEPGAAGEGERGWRGRRPASPDCRRRGRPRRAAASRRERRRAMPPSEEEDRPQPGRRPSVSPVGWDRHRHATFPSLPLRPSCRGTRAAARSRPGQQG